MSNAFDDRAFRDALSSFATGVTIVTARNEDDEPIGMTASSFNSVSVDPPLVLWSVTKSALSASSFKAADHWVVQVLASDQIDLSNRFAKSGEDKFTETDYVDTAQGVPRISGCVAYFECRAWRNYDGGDHWILVGEVLKLDRRPGNPLVFCGGSYAISEPIRSSRSNDRTVEDNDYSEPVEDLLLYQLSRATRQMSERFHRKVSESGLTIPEWRVLASLHGPTTRNIKDLSERTFIDLLTLNDMVHTMAEQGLCTVHSMNDGVKVEGTRQGHDRVSHLFAEGAAIEKTALGNLTRDNADQLKELLREIVRNT